MSIEIYFKRLLILFARTSFWNTIPQIIMDLIQDGLKKKLIRFEDGEKYIVNLPQNKRRNSENPEGKIQADAFLKLTLVYG